MAEPKPSPQPAEAVVNPFPNGGEWVANYDDVVWNGLNEKPLRCFFDRRTALGTVFSARCVS